VQPFEGNGLLKLTAIQRLQWVPFLKKHPKVQGIVIPASDVSHFANPNPIWVVIINMAWEVQSNAPANVLLASRCHAARLLPCFCTSTSKCWLATTLDVLWLELQSLDSVPRATSWLVLWELLEFVSADNLAVDLLRGNFMWALHQVRVLLAIAMYVLPDLFTTIIGKEPIDELFNRGATSSVTYKPFLVQLDALVDFLSVKGALKEPIGVEIKICAFRVWRSLCSRALRYLHFVLLFRYDCVGQRQGL